VTEGGLACSITHEGVDELLAWPGFKKLRLTGVCVSACEPVAQAVESAGHAPHLAATAPHNLISSGSWRSPTLFHTCTTGSIPLVAGPAAAAWGTLAGRPEVDATWRELLQRHQQWRMTVASDVDEGGAARRSVELERSL